MLVWTLRSRDFGLGDGLSDFGGLMCTEEATAVGARVVEATAVDV